MTDKKTKKSKNESVPEEEKEFVGDVTMTPMVIHKQYLKDFSFENPNAPSVFKKWETPPEMDMDIGIEAKKLESDEHEHFYEITMNVQARSSRDDLVMFIAEISYASTVSITGLDEKQHHPLLMIEVPRMLFPFVRQILANATLSGGFMPLQLRPVDFRAMYLKRFAEQANAQKEA